MDDATRILAKMRAGDQSAAEELLPLVYAELKIVAAAKLAQEPSGHTLQATALVHEAYLRLVGGNHPHWDGRRHFFAAAAEAMRRILVETARRKNAIRHGGDVSRIDLEPAQLVAPVPASAQLDLIALDEALNRLSDVDPVKAEIVKLRYFAGLTMREAAVATCLSLATVERHWAFAKAWLRSELADSE